MEKTIPFTRLAGIRNYSSDFSQLGNDYIFSRLTPASGNSTIDVKQPYRVSGLSFCMLLKGSLSVEINSEKYTLTPVSMLTAHDHSLARISCDDWSEIDAYILIISQQFLHDINLDLNAFNFSMIERTPSPVIADLNDEQIDLLKGYMELLNRNAGAKAESICTKNATRSLIQSLIYQLMQIKYDTTKKDEYTADVMQSRKLNYVQDFMKLLQIHHFKERSLTFYADKLFISPKYLSRIIKESTGYSAADWIDRFVVLEAKNMLRFSNKNIQQIAYALNFSTQSSFGKFFKHITGMSPSDYQKT